MASIIDNKNKTLLESMRNSLKQAESVDILTNKQENSCFADKKWKSIIKNVYDSLH